MKNVEVKSSDKIPLHYHLMKVMDIAVRVNDRKRKWAFAFSEKYRGRYDLFMSQKPLSNL